MKAIRALDQKFVTIASDTELGNTALPASENGYYRFAASAGVQFLVKFGTSSFAIDTDDYTLMVTDTPVIVYTDQPDFDVMPVPTGGKLSVEGLEGV